MIVEWKVRLTYPKRLLGEPLIYELIRRFNLVTNIVEAQVTEQIGWLIVTVRGENEMIQKGLDWIVSNGVTVEILSRREE